MESRHKLPAPPLVLQPVFCRVPLGSSRAEGLLDLARFLFQRGLLTGGGVLKLAQGLRGRNQAVSLTTQDVRGRAHGLTLELLEEADPRCWSEISESYFRRFDRGKPRRPTRLQRLYMEWSRDSGWQGILEACQNHPDLWERLRAALAYQADDDRDRTLLELVLRVRDGGGWMAWKAAYEEGLMGQRDLLALLPLLPNSMSEDVQQRLDWLTERTSEILSQPPLPIWSSELLLACRRCPPDPLVPMPLPLQALLSHLLTEYRAEVDPRWLAVLRGYCWSECQLHHFWQKLSPEDPVHRIRFGPRPGRSWLDELYSHLEDSKRESNPA